jgi:hypothetical protein
MAETATPLFVAQDIVTLMPNPAPVVALLALNKSVESKARLRRLCNGEK